MHRGKPNSTRQFTILKGRMLFSISLYLISDVRPTMQFMNPWEKNRTGNELRRMRFWSLQKKLRLKTRKRVEGKEDPRGIPEFWWAVLENAALLGDVLQEHHAPILEPLKGSHVTFCELCLRISL